jgi:hypothetical protein
MKHNVVAAIIVAIGLVVAAFVHTGRYYIVAVGGGKAVRVDRWTGKTKVVSANGPDWLSGDDKNWLRGNSN